MSQTLAYAQPLEVNDPNDCLFYHSMAVPEIGEVRGQWDLRGCVDPYLGNFDFVGKRVLDVGAASGFLTFEMEKRGAEVVSFDMTDGADWNLVPHVLARDRMDEIAAGCAEGHRRLKNSYWWIHRRFASKAKVFYGDIYQLPKELGSFDVAFFGMVLSHLRDPYRALHSVSSLGVETIIVTTQILRLWRRLGPLASFAPRPSDASLLQTWWYFTPRCIEQMLGVLGYETKRTIDSFPRCCFAGREGPERCRAFVARSRR